MDNDNFVLALQSIKEPQDKRKLLQSLIFIRKHIDVSLTNSEHINICESSIIKNLIGCLQLESNSILDTTLSILGNCCTNTNFARNAMKLNILHYLDRVLSKHGKDSIVGRVFRIIGNLCGNTCSLLLIGKEPLLVDKIVNFLNNAAKKKLVGPEISEATILMAVRTIRKLLKKTTLESLIIEHQTLKAVGALLIKYVEYSEISKHLNIIEEVLRLLHAYSHYIHPNIIQNLKNTANGDSLLCLSKLIVVNPIRVTKIIVNLGRFCSLKTDLPMSDIWERLLEKVCNNPNERSYMEYLRSMSSLIDNPSNIMYMKLGDSIFQLISTLRDLATPTNFSMECCILILSMLNKTQYDDTLVLKQISSDIINVLVDKLEWIGISSTEILVHHRKKRKRKRIYTEETKKLKPLTDCDSCTNSFANPTVSYESRCTSPSELSEISSDGPYSPFSDRNQDDFTDSDNYSPVCSDAEDTDINTLPSVNDIEAEYESTSDEDNEIDVSGKIKYKLLFEINTLLWRYSRIKPSVTELGRLRLLITLINLILKNFTLPQHLVLSILKKPDYLLPLMQTKFVQIMYDLTQPIHDLKCSFCNRAYQIGTTVLNSLTKTAESAVCKGDIAHALLRSSIELKSRIVVSIPYIIRNKNLISRLLINCGGLDILLNLIEKKSDVQEDSIKGLCVLSILQLKIKNPVLQKSPNKVRGVNAEDYNVSEACSNVVTFKLDDGSTVSADREFLSSRSDYFNRLLYGSFKESKQTEILLQNITERSLKLLLLLLHSKVSTLGVVNLDLDTILDLLELTERYLLDELNVYLASCVEQLYMSNRTVPLIYQWSIESGTNILRVETIAFALVGDILDTDRINMFYNLLHLGYYKQLREDINKLLIRFLR